MSDTSPCLAKSFLYTAAPFGHSGINGFQFVGLPEQEVDDELIHQVEAHVGFTPPMDAAPQPDDQTIRESYPVSLRLLTRTTGGRQMIIRSAYVGQVYREDGRRGKWGNFLAHALVLEKVAASALFELAQTANWRDGLDREECEAGKALILRDVYLEPSPATDTVGPLSPESLQLALACILARLDGGNPILFLGIGHETAERMYAQLFGLLAPGVLRRLDWSTYEFDGNSDYDVIATTGETRLSLSPQGYQLHDAAPGDQVYLWAAERINADTATFWQTVEIFGGHGDEGSAAQPLQPVLAALMALEEVTSENLAPLHHALDQLREEPVNAARRVAAEMVFNAGFSDIKHSCCSDIVFFSAAVDEADRLDSWAGGHAWSAIVEDWGARLIPIVEAFADPPQSDPLRASLEQAVNTGQDPGELVQAILRAARLHLSRGGNDFALFTALLGGLPKLGSPDRWGPVLEFAQRRSEVQGTVVRLLGEQALHGSAAAFFEIADQIRRDMPEIAAAGLAQLEIQLIVDHFSRDPKNATLLVNQLKRMGTEAWPDGGALQVNPILARLDSALIDATSRDQSELAGNLIELADTFRVPLTVLPHGLTAVATVNPQMMRRVLRDERLGAAIRDGSTAKHYMEFAQRAWVAQAPRDLVEGRATYASLWRADASATLDGCALRHLKRLSSARGQSAERWITAMLDGSRPSAIGPAHVAWDAIEEKLTLFWGLRLDDDSFDHILRLFSDCPVVEDIAKRRKRSILGVTKSFLHAVRALVRDRKRDR